LPYRLPAPIVDLSQPYRSLISSKPNAIYAPAALGVNEENRIGQPQRLPAGNGGPTPHFSQRECDVLLSADRAGGYGEPMARKIASALENELQYPGQIRIIVIRETRCVELAK